MSGARRCNNQTTCRCEPEIDFDFKFSNRLFLLGLLAGSDDFAERARVLAVKSLFERFSDRAGADVFGKHAHPSHRLQQHPMPANRKDKRDHNCLLAQTPAHGADVWQNSKRKVKANVVRETILKCFLARVFPAGIVLLVE